MRSAGILLHISSLPGPEGIGTLGDGAKDFVDFLDRRGQSYWQVLPVGPTGFKDSPYRGFSTFRGNPYFVDLEALSLDGLIAPELLAMYGGNGPLDKVDYGQVYAGKFRALRRAFENFNVFSPEYLGFCDEEDWWLSDYAIFMSLKTQTNLPWNNWPPELRRRDPEALKKYRAENIREIKFWKFVQFEFFRQWENLKKYANVKGIKIIGDLPIYLAQDSCEVWANPSLFCLDEDLLPTKVAGVPPDAFSREGQLWGNPVYNWPVHRRDGYSWWKKRFEQSFRLFDVVRVDHFRGFESYYTIPRGSANAVEGVWEPGPGTELFNQAGLIGGDFRVIAEDLGIITPEVTKMLKECGFPGMKVLQFAFSADLENNDGRYLPHNIDENSVVYTGTHDNNTTLGWWKELLPADKNFCLEYLSLESDENIPQKLVNTAYASRAELAVIPMQDLLGLDSVARMNTPARSDGNWQWRLKKSQLTEDLEEAILRKMKVYMRE